MLDILGHIYYILGIPMTIFSFTNALNYNKFVEIKKWILAFKKIHKKDPDEVDFRSINDSRLFKTFVFLLMTQLIWILFGLLTKSWYVYLSILISFIIIRLINKIIIDKTLGYILFIVIPFTIFILTMNHFHFHFDWIKLVKSS